MSYDFINVIGSLPPVNPYDSSGFTLVKFTTYNRTKVVCFFHDPRKTLTGLKGEQEFPQDLWEKFTKIIMNASSKEDVYRHLLMNISDLIKIYDPRELERLTWVINNWVAYA